MIQAIGIMIGVYIFTRMVELLQSRPNWFLSACAVITLLVVCAGIYILLSGSPMPPRG